MGQDVLRRRPSRRSSSEHFLDEVDRGGRHASICESRKVIRASAYLQAGHSIDPMEGAVPAAFRRLHLHPQKEIVRQSASHTT